MRRYLRCWLLCGIGRAGPKCGAHSGGPESRKIHGNHEDDDREAGKAYYGEVPILGTHYITGYEPIKDSSGAQIGVYYVGYKK